MKDDINLLKQALNLLKKNCNIFYYDPDRGNQKDLWHLTGLFLDNAEEELNKAIAQVERLENH